MGYLEVKDKEGIIHKHDFLYKAVREIHSDHANAQKPHIVGSLGSCKKLTMVYVQNIIDCLNSRFPDISTFNDMKLFSLCYYSHDAITRESISVR